MQGGVGTRRRRKWRTVPTIRTRKAVVSCYRLGREEVHGAAKKGRKGERAVDH